MDISHKRCFNHASREAVARCPECRRYFCRECVTEHEGRVICASCLISLTGGDKPRRSKLLGAAARTLQVAAGILVLWLFFFLMGQSLLALPTSFHEGNIWQDSMMEP